MKHVRRLSLIFFVVLFVFASFPFEAFAVDPVSALAIAGAMDAYGMAYGVGTVYDVTSNSGISDSFTDLWDQFSDYQTSNNHGLPSVNGVSVNYDDYIDEWQTNYKSLHGFSHSSGTFAAWSIDAESAQVFDEFWNWLLTGPAEMVRVDNEFQFSSSQVGSDSVPIPVFTHLDYPAYHLPHGSVGENDLTISILRNYYAQGLLYVYDSYTDSYGTVICCFYTPDSNVYAYSYSRDDTAYPYGVRFVRDDKSEVHVTARRFHLSGLDIVQIPVSVYNGYVSDSSSPYYQYNWDYCSLPSLYSIDFPLYSDFNAGMNALVSYFDDPSSIPSDSVGVKAYSDDGVVTLPNPYGQDYSPVPLEIVTTVPWDTTYNPEDDDNGVPIPWTPSAVPGVVDDIADSISAEDYSIEADPNPDPDPDPEPGPGEVFLPFIPVSIPSFNFNFSGIWHYVREWVASIGSWLSLMFTIWANLPYAIVVPVYASMVIVIVLGVYRRFFM